MTAAHRFPTLSELVPGLSAPWANAVPVDLTLDSREVVENAVFLAIPGHQNDGRDHIEAALAAGALAVLAEREGYATDGNARVIPVSDLRLRVGDLARQFYGDPSASMSLCAVTGTNGKTSIVDFIAQLSSALDYPAATLGTLGAQRAGHTESTRNTTPDVLTTNRYLRRWLDQGVQSIALEASSHALVQDRLSGLSIRTAIFANLTRDHLDYHDDLQDYADAKLALFRRQELEFALYNADCPWAAQVGDVAQCQKAGLTLQGATTDCQVTILSRYPALELELVTPWGSGRVTCQLSGDFNAFNVSAAIITLAQWGSDWPSILRAASTLRSVSGRMEQIDNDRGIRAVVDYAHTPDALRAALMALRPQTPGALWVIFGCGGNRDRGKRAEMGRFAEQLADHVVVTSDNPRNESPEAILDDICGGLRDPATRLVDRREAIEWAVARAAAGDSILVAGKGHEEYQEVEGIRQPFSDRDVLRRALALGGAA